MRDARAVATSSVIDGIHETTVGSVLASAAETAEDVTALIAPSPDGSRELRWTYGELRAQAERVAAALLRRFQPGERIAICAPNMPEWLLLYLGSGLAGTVVVTVNPALRAKELEYILRQSQAAGIFYVDEYRGGSIGAMLDTLAPQLPALRERLSLSGWTDFVATSSPQPLPAVRADDAVMMQYTSGTTGFPKGAVMRHRGITNLSRLNAERFQVEAGDRWLCQMPLFHVAGCVINVLGALQSRNTQVLIPFEPALVQRCLAEYSCRTMIGAPTMYSMLREHPAYAPRSLGGVRVMAGGGSLVPPELARALEDEIGCTFAIFFGQTETSGCFTQTGLDDTRDDRTTTVGTALPHVEVRITDPAHGGDLPAGETGEVRTRGFHVMREYFGMPAETAAAIDADGWLRTGDLGSLDSRGYLSIEGRLKEMIIRGGENIYPREIEQVLRSHPKVADAVVVGLPDTRWGETVAAFVRPAAGDVPSETELFGYCREHLAAHKTPRTWRFTDSFPMTASGKVQKFVLRDQLVAELGQ